MIKSFVLKFNYFQLSLTIVRIVLILFLFNNIALIL